MLRPGGSDFALGADMVPVEIVALTLQSAAPIVVNFWGGTEFSLYDVLVTLDLTSPNGGRFVLTSDPAAPGGGMIDGSDPDPIEPPPIPPDSFFDVCLGFEFIPHDPTLSTVAETRTDRVHLTDDVPWSNLAPPEYAHARAGGLTHTTVGDMPLVPVAGLGAPAVLDLSGLRCG